MARMCSAVVHVVSLFVLPVVVLHFVMAKVSSQVPSAEIFALSQLYSSTNGDSWLWRDEETYGLKWNFILNSSGEFEEDPCSSGWQGLNCSGTSQQCSTQTCHITLIDLEGYGMTGSIPVEVGDLVYLEWLNFESNSLSGSIPSEVGNLVKLKLLNVEVNPLTGQIPSDVGNLVHLESLQICHNSITGSIPSEIGNLLKLKVLVLCTNFLSGPIPSELGNLASLERLILHENALTGQIPGEMGKLVNIILIDIDINAFTGPIPVELGNLVNLEWLNIDDNALTGSIPGELGNLVNLQLLYLFNNGLIGPIPREIGSLANLELLSLGRNFLTGPIPVEVGNLATLEMMDYHDNYLSGSIPKEMGNFQKLGWLVLDNNALTGSIPSEMGKLVSLRLCLLQSNRLSGGIGGVFNASAQPFLDVLDLSDNLLTGSYGEEIFRLPAIRVLALSVNCFEAELPKVMCEASTMEVLSLNGLGSAGGCENKFKVPLSGVLLFNTIGGTLPECVWTLPNLQVLHAVGNEFTGGLAPTLPLTSRIVDLSLSHNLFTGSITRDIQRVPQLDLSHNQLSGRYTYHENLWPHQESLNLEINRLSGKLLRSKLENVSELKVLRGNMISCDSVPKNDHFEDDYICGSADLNESLYVLVVVLLATACFGLILAYFWLVDTERISSHASVVVCVRRLRMYMEPLAGASAEKLPQIVDLCAKLNLVVRLFGQLFAVVALVAFPIYAVRSRDDDAYSSHTNTYAWFWTLAYLHGSVPASLVLMSWSVVLGTCFYRIILSAYVSLDGLHLPRKCTLTGESTPPQAVSTKSGLTSTADASAVGDAGAIGQSKEQVMDPWIKAGVLVLNAAVSITVNSLYIYSTQQPLHPQFHFGIQLSLAVFRLLYSYCVIPYLFYSIVDPVANVYLWIRVLIVDNLVVPCLVTAFASPSCFQGLVFEADAVSTPYMFERCDFFELTSSGRIVCSSWTIVPADSAPVIPPFIYSNQCASVLLTSFIPVLIISYSIQLATTLVVPVLYYQLGRLVDLSQLMLGVLWPDTWLDSESSERNKSNLDNDPTILLNLNSILCFDVLNNGMVMLTFGLCSPALAVAVACVAALKMNLLRLLVGRFTSILRGDHSSEDVHFALATLCKMPFPLTEVLQQSFWLFAWSSALFFAMISWDMAGDKEGWFASLWAPVWALCFPAVLWAIGLCVKEFRTRSTSSEGHHLESSMSNDARSPNFSFVRRHNTEFLAMVPPSVVTSSSLSPEPQVVPQSPAGDASAAATLPQLLFFSSPNNDSGAAVEGYRNPMHADLA